MNEQDHAIVVGISRYPGFGATPTDAANLNAPVRDANDIHEWLVSPRGGGLLPENAKLICSDEGAAAPTDVLSAAPKLQEIQDEFYKLVLKADENERAGNGLHVGRRLYIYMSGHGFAPGMYTGCLFVANATTLTVPNVFASGWLEGFKEAAYFDEFVLWMDCCMDRQITVVPEAIALRSQQARPRPPAPTMVAFAASRPLRTIETTIDGAVHSVFTHTLLKGLNGAAMDQQSGRVTGRSLGDYLLNAMKDWIPPAEMNNPLIAKEPNIVEAAAGLVLVEAQEAGFAAQSYPVTLRFPNTPLQPQPSQARLWRGIPPRADTLEIVDGVASIACERGLYVVEVPGQGLRKGFEVTGSGPVEVGIGLSDRGAPVQEPPPGRDYRLDIDLGGASEIFVVDADFKLVGRGRGGWLKEQKPFGIYKIKTRLGRELHEKVIFLDSDAPIELGGSSLLGAPILLPKEGLPDQGLPAAEHLLSQVHVYAGDGAEILLMVRDEPPLAAGRDGSPVPVDSSVSYGTRLLDAARHVLADLDVHGVRRRQGEDIGGQPVAKPLACCRITVSPGAYYLQRQLSGGTLQEQTILAMGGFRTEMHEIRSRLPAGAGQELSREQVMVMFDLHAPLSDQQVRDHAELIEAATVALADHRKILTDHLHAQLATDFKDPVTGLLGAHLLVIEAESDPEFDPAAGIPSLDAVVIRLRTLVGNGQPDVEALSQRCADRNLRGKGPLQYPPLFSRSWKIAVAASDENETLVPAALWEQVHAKLPAAPYCAWATDDRSREAHAEGLVSQVLAAMRAPSAPAELRRQPAAVPEPAPAPAGAPMPSRSPFGVPHAPVATAPARAAPPVASDELVSRLAKQWSIPTAALDRLLVTKAPNARQPTSRRPP
ncbi:MAG: hypothetical protein ABWY02_07420 [Telluria sp.]